MGEGKALPYSRIPKAKCRSDGNRTSLADATVILFQARIITDAQMSGWKCDENEIFTVSKYPPTRYFLITKGKLTLQREGWLPPPWPGDQSGHHRCWGMAASGASCKFHGGRNVTSVVFLPKTRSPTLIISKHQTNPNGKTFCKATGQCSSQVWRSRKTNTKEPPTPDEKRQRRMTAKGNMWFWIGSWSGKRMLIG